MPARWCASSRIVPTGGLPAARRSFGRFQAMVERIADQVVQRCLQPIENIAVDAGRCTDDFESSLLAQLARRSRTNRGKPRIPSASGRIRLLNTS